MELKLFSIIYIAFRLAPFILVSYLSLSSLFGQDYKAIVYLAGLLIACFLTVLFSKNIPVKWITYEDTQSNSPDICNSLTLTGSAPFSLLPLSQTVFSFTFFYLFFVIYKYGLVKLNIPTLIIFPILIIADLLWNVTYKCSSFFGNFLSIAIGTAFGFLWAYIIDKSKATDLQYFNGISGKQVCSRPQRQLFKCSNINTNGQIYNKSNSYFSGEGNESITLASTALNTNTYNFYQTDSAKELIIPNSGIYIITVDAGEKKDPYGIYSFMVSGIKGGTKSATFISDVLLDKDSPQPFNSAVSKSNGVFTVSTMNSKHTQSRVYFYELYSNNVKTLLSGPHNMNTGSGGKLQSYTLPSSGLFFMTIDGGDKSLTDANQIYCFYLVACKSDNTNVSYVSSLNSINYGTQSKGLNITGNVNGKFDAIIVNGDSAFTNYNVYYKQLYGDNSTMKLLNASTMPININPKSGGSSHTFTLPTSGVFIITVDSGSRENVNGIYSFYISGCLESSNLSYINEIANPASDYSVVGLGNAQFTVSFTNSDDKKTNAFNVYYYKVYP
jgi:hypothetical protein